MPSKPIRLALAFLAVLLATTNLPAGTLTGTITSANTSVPLQNATLTLTPSQAAYIAGSFAITGDPVSCFTSIDGSVVGLRNPLLAPIVTPSTASGTLAANTYYTVITYWNASGQTMVSPETVTVLSGIGNLLVAAPASQPANATGYKVSISTTSGLETLQSTVTGWGSYTQSSALSAGAAIPASNTTTCSVRFNDEMIPTRTKYNVVLRRVDGSTVSGWPQRWTLQGGSAGVINLSNGYPYSVSDVIYPEPLLLTPPTNAQQSVNSPVTFNNYDVTARTFISNVADGTPPFASTSKTPPTNLTVRRINSTTTANTANAIDNVYTNPAAPRTYTIPDPGGNAFYVMSTGGANSVDCTGVLTCTLTTKIYFEAAGANGSTGAMGWDTFSTNAPVAGVITGTNTQKGVMKFKAAVNLEQQASGTSNTSTVTATPLTTTAGNLLIAAVSVNGAATITGCNDGSAYTLAKRQQNGATLGVEIWYRQNASALAGATLTCTASGASIMALTFYEYSGAAAVALDATQGGTGTGTSLATTATATTAQASELIFAAAAVQGVGLSATAGSGFNLHTIAINVSAPGVSSLTQGMIANATGTFTGPMTIGSSVVWSEAIATFKAVSATAPTQTAQRGYKLPADFVAPLDFNWVWFAPSAPNTGTVQLGVATVCTASSVTDDPAFNTASTVTASVPGTTRTMTVTPISAVTITGCDPGEMLHLQVQRISGSTSDNYEREVEAYGFEITTARSQ